MATKVKMLKLLQELRGFAEINRRSPAPRSSALYLFQLRSHVTSTSLSKRRIVIPVDVKGSPNFPDAVQIKHVKSDSASQA